MPVQWALHPHSRRHCFTTPIGSILALTVAIRKINLVVFDDHEMKRHSSFFVLSSTRSSDILLFYLLPSIVVCHHEPPTEKRYVERESYVNIITQIIFLCPCHFLYWPLALLPTPFHSVYGSYHHHSFEKTHILFLLYSHMNTRNIC